MQRFLVPAVALLVSMMALGVGGCGPAADSGKTPDRPEESIGPAGPAKPGGPEAPGPSGKPEGTAGIKHKQPREEPAPGHEGVIGLSVLTLTNPFFVDLAEAAKVEGAKHGFTVDVKSGEFNVANQKDQIQDFITKQVTAIVLCPCDSKAIGPSIAEANQHGIPVFTADIACVAEGAEVVCHVASDNYGGGKKAAEAMIDVLGTEGNVAILDHAVVESVMMRTKGFREVIGEKSNLRIVKTLPGGGAREVSFKATQDLLQGTSDLNGIFAINDPSGKGAAAALENAQRAGEIQIVAFDAMPEGRQAVKDGEFYATIVQYPDKIGRTVVQQIVQYLEGEPVPKEVLIPCTIYRKAEADADPTLP